MSKVLSGKNGSKKQPGEGNRWGWKERKRVIAIFCWGVVVERMSQSGSQLGVKRSGKGGEGKSCTFPSRTPFLYINNKKHISS